MLSLILLVGCGNSRKIEKESMNLYETYWKSLLNESKFQTSSRSFNIEHHFLKEDDTYAYYLTIDQAKIAMYDVEIIVIENSENYNATEDTLPSAGIFESKFNLVPNQVRKDSPFKGGANLVRQELEDDEVTIRVLVAWKNYTKLDSFKEVFEFDLKYEEPTTEETEETVEE